MDSESINILLIEDDPGDASLVKEILHPGNGDSIIPACLLTHFERLDDGLGRLAGANFDVILSDLSLPDSQGADTFRRLRQAAPETPLIMLTNNGDKAPGMQALREGAQDFLPKDRLDEYSLTRAIRYAIERKQAIEAVRESEKRFRALVENSADAIVVIDANGVGQYASPASTSILGFSPEEMVGQDGFRIIHPDDIATAQQVFQELLSQPSRTVCTQLRLQHKDGSWRWIEATAKNLLNEPGVEALVINYRDITQRRQAEEHDRYQAMLLESISEAVISTDENFVIRSWNKVAERLHGYTAEEAIGHSTREVLSGDYIGLTRDEARQQLLATGRWEGEVIAKRKDGAPVNVYVSTTLLRDGQGSTIGMLAINRDITERKRAEAALQDSEASFRLLFASNPHPMWVYDLSTLEFLEVNQAAIQKYGYSRDEFLRLRISDIRPAEDVPRLMTQVHSDRPLLQQSGPWRHVLKGGQTIDVEINSHRLMFAGRQAVLVIAQDITARLQAEQALRESERRYRTLAEAAQDMIFILSLEGRVEYVNDYGATAFGLKAEEMIGHSTTGLFPSEALAHQRRNVHQAIESRSPVYAESRTPFPNGPRWLGTSLVPLQDEAGEIYGVLGIARDITKQKQAEEALRTSEKRFRALIENSADAIALLDREGRLLPFRSPAAQRILGYAMDENQGQEALNLVHPDDRPHAAQLLYQAIQKPGLPVALCLRAAHKDGSWRWLEASATNLLDEPSVRALVVNYRDITEKKRDEDELRKLWLAVEQSPTSIVITDTHANIEYVNPNFTQVTGYAREEVLGRNPRLLQSGLTPPEEYQRLWNTLTAGQVWQGEFVNKKKNGELYWEAATISPITSADGAITNYLAIKEDITERKQVEKAMLRHADELTVLHAVAVASTEATNEDALIERATEILGATLYPDNFGILLLDASGEKLAPHPSYHSLTQQTEAVAIPAGRDLVAQAALSGQPRRIADASLEPQYARMFGETRSELCVPLKIGARVVGVINAESRSLNAFSEADEKLLTTLAGQLATGIEKARLVDALRKSEVKFRSLVEQVPAVTYEVELGRESRTTYISPQIETILGFTPEEWLADRDLWIHQIHPEDRSKVLEEVRTHDSQGTALDIEYRALSRDNRVVWFRNQYVYVRGEAGRPDHLHGLMLDITERKQAEEALRVSEERFRFIARATNDAIWDWDLQTDTVWWSDAIATIFGYGQEDMETANESWVGRIHPDDKERVFFGVKGVIESGGRTWSDEYRFRRADGTYAHVIDRGYVVHDGRGNAIRMLGSMMDITERIEANVKLREAEARYRLLVEKLPAVTYIVDPQHGDRTLYISPQIESLLGFTPEEWLADPEIWFRQIHPDDRERVLADDASSGVTREFVSEYRLLAKDGRVVWVHDESHPVLDDNGQLLYIQGTEYDITGRKMAEEALRASEARLSEALQITQLAYWERNIHNELFSFNDQFYALLRTTAEREGGYTMSADRYVQRFVHPDDVRLVHASIQNTIDTTDPAYSHQIDHRVIYADGEIGYITVRLRIEKDAHGRTIRARGAIQDITERKQRERELEAIAALSAALRSASTRGDMLPIILDQVMDWLKAESAGLVMKDPVTGEGVHELVRGKHADWIGMRRPPGKGGSGHVMATGRPYQISDPQNDPIVYDPSSINENESISWVPLIAQGTAIGALWVSQTSKMAEGELRVLIAIADIAANAIRRAALHEETRTRAEQLAAVNRLGRALAETLDLPHIYEQCRDAIFSLLPEVAALFISAHSADTHLIQPLYGFQDSRILSVDSAAPYPLQDDPQSECIRTRQPVTINDLSAAGQGSQVNAAEGAPGPRINAVLCAPMIVKGAVTGVVQVQSYTPHHFTANDASLLAFVANTAAIAIENARLFGETRKQLERLQALRTVDSAVTASLDLRVTLNILLEQVTAQLGADAASILLLHSHTHTLEYSAGRGFRTPAIERTQLRIGEGLAGRAALERQPVGAHNLAAAGNIFKRTALVIEEGFVAYYAVPLIARGNVKGVLEVFHRAPLVTDYEWKGFAETLASQAAIAVENISLFNELQRSNTELTLAYDTTLEGWTRALDLRDKETEGHTQRVTEMTLCLGRAMGLDEIQLLHLRRGALLHDVGKFGTPDAILHKPGPLTDEERSIMRRHPEHAHSLLRPIAFLRQAVDVPYCHHERWDGSGYPRGLKGDQIPLAARIFAIVDVWDALRSDRPFRPAWPADKVRAYLVEQSGQMFDPQVVDVFMKLVD